MATLLTDITSADWQVSLLGAGNIEQGLADVRQCIDIILRTKKGTDPLRPDFGSDIYKHIDTPVNIAVANMKLAILEAIQIWETRVKIVSITHIITGSQIEFLITYSLIDDSLLDSVQLHVNGSVVIVGPPTQLIIEALFPEGYSGRQMLLEFIVDSSPVLPTPPPYGFADPDQMLNWVQANWGFYGNWYLLTDRIVLFMRPGIAHTASLNITLSGLFRITAEIPNISTGNSYLVKIEPDGLYANPALTLSELLAWLNAQWNEYGYWVIENIIPSAGDFNDDFNDDFFTQGTPYLLVLYSERNDLTIEVTQTT